MAKGLHSKKVAHVLLKLDISKAFDSMAWPFLLEVLSHLGFGRRWCNLLCLLLSTAPTQILVNGDPGPNIVRRRRLRQGHPLSPMLFILVISLICWATQLGFLQPLAMECVQHRISVYADDVVMFCWPNTNDLNLIKLLDFFGQVFGLVETHNTSNVMYSFVNFRVLLISKLKQFPIR
jgi:hypothetical protein